MKKALIYASVASMIQQFNMNNIRLLLSLNYQVDVACNFEFGSTITTDKIEQLKGELTNLGVRYYHIPVPRKISDIYHLKTSYRKTIELMNKEKYDLIHCHSPIGGIICRMANHKSHNYEKCRMIYTAHGFHFFNGNNPIKNFMFRNIEKIGARYTDVLITINKEDYAAAQRFHLKRGGKVEYIPGIGIDLEKIDSVPEMRKQLLHSLHLSADSVLMLSVGELNDNKNHRVIIETLPNLPHNFHYLICGLGPLMAEHQKLAEDLGVSERLHLLGFRNDVLSVMKSCDLFVFPSKREGLSVALMEALACELPCIASNIRGNSDLILDKKNGLLVSLNKQEEWKSKIMELVQLKESGMTIQSQNMHMYSVASIMNKMECIYIGR